MKKRRIIFYSIFGAYQLIAFIFTMVMESNTGFLFKLVQYVGWFKYATFLGFALVVADFVWTWMDGRANNRNEEAMRHENNVLKAKVYDLQEGKKESPEIHAAK